MIKLNLPLKTILIFFLTMILISSSAYAAPKYELYDSVTVSKIMQSTNIFELQARAAVLMDADTGSVLLEKSAHERLPIASITKIMSMLLIMEAIDNGSIKMDDVVTISETSYKMGGSQVYLEPGEKFTVKELLKAVAVESANDATVALAEHVAGSEEVFVQKMNEKAKALNMNNTNFIDCTGLTDDNHYSSAYDVAVMSRELITRHPQIFEFSKIWMTKFRPDGHKAQMVLSNTNKLIRHYEGVVTGLKTGFTRKAGYCLSLTGSKNNLNMIAVVLGEPDTNTRFAEARKLIDYGFSNYERSRMNNAGELARKITIKKGMPAVIDAIFESNADIVVKKGIKDKIQSEIIIDENLKPPLKKGEVVGKAIYKVDGEVIYEANIIAAGDVQKVSTVSIFYKMIVKWFSLGKSHST